MNYLFKCCTIEKYILIRLKQLAHLVILPAAVYESNPVKYSEDYKTNGLILKPVGILKGYRYCENTAYEWYQINEIMQSFIRLETGVLNYELDIHKSSDRHKACESLNAFGK